MVTEAFGSACAMSTAISTRSTTGFGSPEPTLLTLPEIAEERYKDAP